MSPTVFRQMGYRFFFFFREEKRMHIHVHSENGEAKFWMDPQIELAKNHKLSKHQINEIEQILEVHYGEIEESWYKHFKD